MCLNKLLVVIAVELLDPKGFGRICLRRIPEDTEAHVLPFIQDVVCAGGTISTDGSTAYRSVASPGYTHDRHVMLGRGLGTVESAKTVLALHAPLSFVLTMANDAAEEHPALLNLEPYGSGWMVRGRPLDWAGMAESLFASTEKQKSIHTFMREAANLGVRFIGCAMALQAHTREGEAFIPEYSGDATATNFVLRALDPEWSTLVF